LVQVSDSNIISALNLVCSAQENGIGKEQFVFWSSDPRTRHILESKSLFFISDPEMIHENQEYSENILLLQELHVWKLVNQITDFWYIPPEAIISRPLQDLVISRDVMFHINNLTDVNLQLFHMRSNLKTRTFLRHAETMILDYPDWSKQRIWNHIALNSFIVDFEDGKDIRLAQGGGFNHQDIWTGTGKVEHPFLIVPEIGKREWLQYNGYWKLDNQNNYIK
jgi:hypothetical protein